MKKNLRLLCLGLAAATFTAGFAQAENVTSKLINADMEQGVVGWNLKFDSHIWKKNTKRQTTHPGYHGVNNVVLENWKGDATSGLTNNTISQTVKELPNGTYVFGAYVVASLQAQEENRESVTGVTLFANDASVPVATNNPEVKSQKWGHAAKFNVAANVVDGTLTVGLKAEATNANFLLWDNATLYYFGDMDAAAALDEMAKIDMAATVAIADTCVAYKMHVDTAAYLNEQIAAGKALVSAAEAYNTDENVYWAIRLANNSIADYRSLNSAIVEAEEVAAGDWNASVAEYVDALNALIVEAKAVYEAAATARPELNEKKTALNEAAALVSLDSCYDVMDGMNDIVQDLNPSDELGEYSEAMINQLYDLLGEVDLALEAAFAGEESAVRTHDIYDSLYVAIQDILANPNSVDEFPIVIERSDEAVLNYNLIKGATVDESGVATYTSKTYRFQYPLTKVRFTIKETGSNGLTGSYPFFTLSSFEMFDENGEEIYLSADDITSNACHNTLNPGSPDGQGILGLVDDDPATFFHSTWGVTVNEPHYIEVALPEGQYSAFSFAMTARSSSHTHQFPAVLEINHLSDAAANLQSAIGAAKGMNAYRGTAPGFYNADLTAFNEALAAAEALMGTEASDADIMAAIAKLEEEQTKLDEIGIVMPEPGKSYRFISAGPFFGKQGVQKAITTHSDSTKTNWLWWETASPDSAQQEFSFEVIDAGKSQYAIKHVASGLYVGALYDNEGEVVDNAFGLNVAKDTVVLESLGYGQFGFVHEDRMMHCGDHNSGTASTSTGWYGGISGVSSSLVSWRTAAHDASAWYIREARVLPYAAKSLSDLNFESETITLYSGINALTLTADKDCAYANLKVYDLLGAEIPATVAHSGATATVVLDTTVVEAFSFAFTNAEGVATVTVDGAISKLSILQDAYEAAVAVNPTPGDQIGQVSDLAEYKAAIAAAEAILANGGTDEAIQQAANDLDSAVVHLVYNLPLADKEYFLISALPAFKENHGVDVAVYAKEDNSLCWSYVGVSDPAYLWKFIPTEPMYGSPAFYIQNVACGTYTPSWVSNSNPLVMVAETAATQPYRIDVHSDSVMTLSDANYLDANLHMAGHGGGSSAFGSMVHWGSTVGTASALRIVEKEHYLSEVMAGIEDVEFVDEYVAPAKKGFYDLFGRRIEAPAATGIYIVDGKKRVIKK